MLIHLYLIDISFALQVHPADQAPSLDKIKSRPKISLQPATFELALLQIEDTLRRECPDNAREVVNTASSFIVALIIVHGFLIGPFFGDTRDK
jgi:hypothetical protein